MRHIGVDLGKRSFTACSWRGRAARLLRSPMSRDGLASFRDQLEPDDRLAVEAGPTRTSFTTRCGRSWLRSRSSAPRQFAVIATSTKKTDREDAHTLARFLELGCLPAVTVPETAVRELRQLFTTRDTLVHMTTQLRTRGSGAQRSWSRAGRVCQP